MPDRPTHNPTIIAFGCVFYGALLLAFPGQYVSGTYKVAFDIVGPRVWAMAFLVVGLFVLAYRNAITVSVLAALVMSWCVSLTLSIVEGTAPTLGGPIPWAILATCLLASIWRHGVPK
ncbi:MAG: hypothetical protein AB7R77_12680 [Ilumatobacteraceae bacterium]